MAMFSRTEEENKNASSNTHRTLWRKAAGEAEPSRSSTLPESGW